MTLVAVTSCPECFNDLYQRRSVYILFEYLVVQYVWTGSAVKEHFCYCCHCLPLLSRLNLLESMGYVKTQEVEDGNILIIPLGIDFNKTDKKNIFLCMCEDE